MADKGFKDQLDNIRRKILQKKEFRETRVKIPTPEERETDRREGLRNFTAGVRELEKDKRITGAALARFDIVTKEEESKIEDLYPKTSSALFKISENIIKEVYGRPTGEKRSALTQEMITWDTLLMFLILHVCKHGEWRETECPEILFSMRNTSMIVEIAETINGIKEEKFGELLFKEKRISEDLIQLSLKIKTLMALVPLFSREKKIFIRLFHRYLDNIANPSSVGIDLMLKKGDHPVDKTLRAAMNLKNKTERARSINHIVESLIRKDQVDEALRIVRTVTKKNEVNPLTYLLNHALNPKKKMSVAQMSDEQIEVAIKMAETVDEGNERDRLYQRMASLFATHNKTDYALAVVSKISDLEIKDFALSAMTCAFVAKENFSQAIQVASLITDPDFQEDANSYIVKGLIENRTFAEVIAFVEGVQNPVLKTKAAKLILSSVRSIHDVQKANEVCSRFHIMS